MEVTQHNILRTHSNSIVDDATASRPLVITAQEVCNQTLEVLIDELNGLGYGTAAVTNGVTNAACPGGGLDDRLWVVVFIQAYVPGTARYGSVCCGRPPVWMCVVGSYGLRWRGCTFHLTSGNFQLAWEEAAAMQNRLLPGISAEATVVGADFNLRPRLDDSTYDTEFWRDNWWEGDNTCFNRNIDRKTYMTPGQPYYKYCPTSGYRRDTKIDYTWADRLNFTQAYGLATIDYGAGSDHYLYVSAFLFQ